MGFLTKRQPAMGKKRVASNVEWERWGQVDPLYGVASWAGKERGGVAPWTDDEFYQLGRSDWQDFLAHWKKYGVDNTSCLEIGCGAGRITMHLARYFRTTHAVDVSREMITYARQHIRDPSVNFYLTNGMEIPLDNPVNAVFSTHVFQHFDSLNHASDYFAEISRVLTPGGSLMIHLPIYNWPVMPSTFELAYRLRRYAGNIKAWILRRLVVRGLSRPFLRGLGYPISYFYDALPKYGFTDVEISIFATKSNNRRHPFVFARKANSTPPFAHRTAEPLAPIRH